MSSSPSPSLVLSNFHGFPHSSIIISVTSQTSGRGRRRRQGCLTRARRLPAGQAAHGRHAQHSRACGSGSLAPACLLSRLPVTLTPPSPLSDATSLCCACDHHPLGTAVTTPSVEHQPRACHTRHATRVHALRDTGLQHPLTCHTRYKYVVCAMSFFPVS